MVEPVVIASAQMQAENENIRHNLKEHYKLIRLAAENGVKLLVFPEMSITGYVREAADDLAFSRHDPRLETLRALSYIHDMIIVAGAPVRLPSGLHIGAFILYPEGTVSIYTKKYLHPDEEQFFKPGIRTVPFISLGGEKISLAICFDIENPSHVKSVKDMGSTIYCPGIFYSEQGMDDAHALLARYAKNFQLCILMSNFCGRMRNTMSGGRSAFWSEKGTMCAGLDNTMSGLVIGMKINGIWTGKTVAAENDVYNFCPIYKKGRITLRRTQPEDAEELVQCYSDEKAVPLFNSDNCDGDDFHYTTLARMRQAIDFWTYSYKTRQFVRWTVYMKKARIGTIEMYDRGTNASLDRYGILRIDLRSDYETRPVIEDILEIAREHFYDAFDVNTILTKAVPAAATRINALQRSGYNPLEGELAKFGNYYVRKIPAAAVAVASL